MGIDPVHHFIEVMRETTEDKDNFHRGKVKKKGEEKMKTRMNLKKPRIKKRYQNPYSLWRGNKSIVYLTSKNVPLKL
jgi:hypothetical protein